MGSPQPLRPGQREPQEGQSRGGFAASVALAAAHMAGSCLHPLQPALCALSGQESRRKGRGRRGNRKLEEPTAKKKKKAISPDTAAGV